ncbi:MAG: hypothetical protein DMF59_08045 [Acidobacteria bacterium]|nr:MAG: hypothetical protein DMF59_08045 [Acidobacteriota bacterium]
MKAKALLGEFREAEFIGQVAGLRSTYYILRTDKHFILITQSGPLAGNFNLVTRRAVESVQRRFGGKKGLTSAEILKRSSAVKERFDVLRILYVLEAMKQATKRIAKPPARGFVFDLKKRR